VKIALVGAGGRGTGAAVNALGNAAHKNVKLVAVADAFRDRLDKSLKAIQTRFPTRSTSRGAEVRRPGRLSAAMDCGADLVLLCSPPGFRPLHFAPR